MQCEKSKREMSIRLFGLVVSKRSSFLVRNIQQKTTLTTSIRSTSHLIGNKVQQQTKFNDTTQLRRFSSSLEELDELAAKLRQKPTIPKNVDVLKKKITYLSNERGMLENDLLLGSFTKLHLDKMSVKQLENYLIFLSENDRDILNWIMNDQPIPDDLDADLIAKLKHHVKNNPLDVLRKEL